MLLIYSRLKTYIYTNNRNQPNFTPHLNPWRSHGFNSKVTKYREMERQRMDVLNDRDRQSSTDTERQTDSQAQTQRDRQTVKHRHRETDRQSSTDTERQTESQRDQHRHRHRDRPVFLVSCSEARHDRIYQHPAVILRSAVMLGWVMLVELPCNHQIVEHCLLRPWHADLTVRKS